MNQTLAVWLLIALALVSANLPFLTERVFAVLPWKQAGRPRSSRSGCVWWKCWCSIWSWARWVSPSSPRWATAFPRPGEFYAITLSLFLVLAYPGFVYRYLFKRHPRLRT